MCAEYLDLSIRTNHLLTYTGRCALVHVSYLTTKPQPGAPRPVQVRVSHISTFHSESQCAGGAVFVRCVFYCEHEPCHAKHTMNCRVCVCWFGREYGTHNISSRGSAVNCGLIVIE